MLFAAIGKLSFAQKDSVQHTKFTTSWTTEYGLDRNLPQQTEDTVIRRNEIYHTLYKKYGLFQDLGNIGTPGRNLFFESNRNTDFYLGFNPWKAYFKTPSETRYYQTKIPYADLNYVQGPMDLLLLNAKFSLNITPRLNIGVDYDRITSLGFYPRQYTSGYFSNIFSSYKSKNKRYALLTNVNLNRGVLDESGGIRSDSLYETLRGSNKAVPVHLLSSQSRYRNATWFVKQYFYLGKKKEQIKEDDTTYQIQQQGFISHTIRYDYDRFAFDNLKGDTSALLFPNKNTDTSAIFSDSISSRTLMNRFAYAYWSKGNDNQQSFIEFAIAHKYIEVHQYNLTHTYNNVWGEASLERLPKSNNNLGMKLHGSYCLSGYNQNDVKLSGDIKYINKFIDMVGGITNQLYTPDYTMVYFRSDPFVWDNRFSKINVSNWHAGFATKIFRNNFYFTFNQYIISNWVYNSEKVMPVQTNQVLLINTIEVNKTFKLWLFYFENRLLFQHADMDIIRLPSFAANLRYYLNGFLFKRALQLQIGGELFYNTAYYGNAYNPAARSFYLQNDKLIGNYPMIDVFVTGQIKKAILFAKLEHVNMGLQNTGFYYTANYPLPILAFRIGVRWRMYN